MESSISIMNGNNRRAVTVFLMFIASCLINLNVLAASPGGVWSNNNLNRQQISDYAGNKNIHNNGNNNGYSLVNNNGADVSDTAYNSAISATSVASDNNGNDGNDETMFYVRPGSFGSYNSGGIRRLMGGPDSVRNFRSSFENLRFMSPYALRHYLASRLQNSDFLDSGSKPSKRLNKDNSLEEDQIIRLKALSGDFYKQIKDKKINNQLLMKNIGWIKPPKMFQYYTKGSEFLGGPGR